MKTAEEKAFNLLHGLNIKGKLFENLYGAVIATIKEQDRDTRHACAEAVLGCSTVCEDIDTGKGGDISG